MSNEELKEVLNKISGGYNVVGKDEINTIKIYQGGKKYFKTAGDECDFKLRDIIINLKYIDIDKLLDDDNPLNNKDFILNKISNTFKLKSKDSNEEDIIKEIKYLLSLTNEELSFIYVRKFNLFLIFSDALKPLFFEIVKYFENQIKLLMKLLNIDLNKYINKWKNENIKKNINTSSIILCNIGKDKNFIDELKKYQYTKHFVEYISNNNKWNYLGFCPYDPTIRMIYLLKFPLESIFNIFKKLDQNKYVKDQMKKIKQIESEKIKQINPPYIINNSEDNISDDDSEDNISDDDSEDNISDDDSDLHDSEILIGNIKKLLCKLHDSKKILNQWELYYIENAKLYSKLSKKFYEIFTIK